jgi:hypothetical protein
MNSGDLIFGGRQLTGEPGDFFAQSRRPIDLSRSSVFVDPAMIIARHGSSSSDRRCSSSCLYTTILDPPQGRTVCCEWRGGTPMSWTCTATLDTAASRARRWHRPAPVTSTAGR